MAGGNIHDLLKYLAKDVFPPLRGALRQSGPPTEQKDMAFRFCVLQKNLHIQASTISVAIAMAQ